MGFLSSYFGYSFSYSTFKRPPFSSFYRLLSSAASPLSLSFFSFLSSFLSLASSFSFFSRPHCGILMTLLATGLLDLRKGGDKPIIFSVCKERFLIGLHLHRTVSFLFFLSSFVRGASTRPLFLPRPPLRLFSPWVSFSLPRFFYTSSLSFLFLSAVGLVG